MGQRTGEIRKCRTIPVHFHSDRESDAASKSFTWADIFFTIYLLQIGTEKRMYKNQSQTHYESDLNAILSDLIFTRIQEPDSKRSSFQSS